MNRLQLTDACSANCSCRGAILRDETDTALVRFFRTRRWLFTWLLRAAIALVVFGFVIAPLVASAR